ncbi:MAG: biosynthetic arginine decarboxylase [Cyanobacteria bacterium P01_G01_bin.67]
MVKSKLFSGSERQRQVDQKISSSIITSNQPEAESTWTIEDSKHLYGIEGWGEPYFAINTAGNITVTPQGRTQGISLDLYDLVESLKQRDIQLPLLIRFSDILADRMERLSSCMNRAIARYKYSGAYQGVFPIKCNQHRHLIESLVDYGKSCQHGSPKGYMRSGIPLRDTFGYGICSQFGLEAGSKPELIIALAALAEKQQREDLQPLLICNGYKDREYIETALLAMRLRQQPIIVIEQLEELYLTLEISRQLDIKPILGVRAKLNSRGAGRWGNSTGDRAKFGLSIPQILQVLQKLEALGMLDCLQLLHFHIGSQISAIASIKDAIREASQIYVQLAKMEANMKYLDVGGGLAVDYDGSKTNFPASKNYNMQNYANDIVAQVKDACDQGKVEAPILISESGRAIAAHQSVLVFDILDTNDVDDNPPPLMAQTESLVLTNFWETYQLLDETNYQESYHDAIQLKEEALSLFNLGYLSLVERSLAEQIYWACCYKIANITKNRTDVPEDLANLDQTMASIYYANLSIFQSVPDAWAIKQLFPIMPIHRLDEEPTVKGILADITCDSDGKIDRFIDHKDVKSLLELHPLQKEQPYYLGIFLVGAYQEIMGNLHNLFGKTNVAHIKMTAQGYQIEHIVKGDLIKEVLNYVDYDPGDLLEIMRRRTETALGENRITIDEAQKLLKNYERGLNSYTYLVRK